MPTLFRRKRPEPLGLLCFVAGATERVKLLTSIIVIPYRPALLQAKLLTTVDVLSKGRLLIGCGVGWMKEEFEALGVPFAARGRMADEYLTAFKELWRSDDPSFEGEFVRFSGIAFAPKPVQKPHPPFWIGGAGRDPAGIGLAYSANWFSDPTAAKTDDGGRRLLTGPTAALQDDVAKLTEAGVSDLVLNFNSPTRVETIDRMAAFMREVVGRS